MHSVDKILRPGERFLENRSRVFLLGTCEVVCGGRARVVATEWALQCDGITTKKQRTQRKTTATSTTTAAKKRRDTFSPVVRRGIRRRMEGKQL
jgi:hypothetical protein